MVAGILVAVLLVGGFMLTPLWPIGAMVVSVFSYLTYGLGLHMAVSVIVCAAIAAVAAGCVLALMRASWVTALLTSIAAAVLAYMAWAFVIFPSARDLLLNANCGHFPEDTSFCGGVPAILGTIDYGWPLIPALLTGGLYVLASALMLQE